jgi:ABC-type amino acid transport system permease subunit
LGINISAFSAASIDISLNSSAYVSEIVRAGTEGETLE